MWDRKYPVQSYWSPAAGLTYRARQPSTLTFTAMDNLELSVNLMLVSGEDRCTHRHRSHGNVTIWGKGLANPQVQTYSPLAVRQTAQEIQFSRSWTMSTKLVSCISSKASESRMFLIQCCLHSFPQANWPIQMYFYHLTPYPLSYMLKSPSCDLHLSLSKVWGVELTCCTWWFSLEEWQNICGNESHASSDLFIFV